MTTTPKQGEARIIKWVRCNHCMTVFDECYLDSPLTEFTANEKELCPVCKKDDALMDLDVDVFKAVTEYQEHLRLLKTVYSALFNNEHLLNTLSKCIGEENACDFKDDVEQALRHATEAN